MTANILPRLNNDMPEIVVAKSEYDQMIDKFPGWMRDVWTKFPKKWNISTIAVRQCAGSGLADRINYVRGYNDSI